MKAIFKKLLFPIMAITFHINCHARSITDNICIDGCPNIVSNMFDRQGEELLNANKDHNADEREYAFYGQSYATSYDDQHVSDAQLMKQYIIANASKIKKRSIIGGSILSGIGAVTILAVYLASSSNDTLSDDSINENTLIGACIGVPMIIGGGVWIGVAHYKANKMINEVKYLSIIKHDILSKGENKLSASLDIVNNHGLINTRGIGLSLCYSF